MCVVEAASAQAQSAPQSIRQHLSRLCDFGNVPRNQKKFANFVKNSLKIHQDATIDQMWKHLEDLHSKSKQEATVTPSLVLEKDKVEEGKNEEETLGEVDAEDAVAANEAERKLQKKLKKKLKREREAVEALPTEEGEEEGREKKKKKKKNKSEER